MSVDDGNVRAEVEKIEDRGTAHPPPPQPVRFSPTILREEESIKGRIDVKDDTAQADSVDTLQDGPLATDRSVEFYQMEDVIYTLRDEVQTLQHTLRKTREEEPQYEFSPLGTNYYNESV